MRAYEIEAWALRAIERVEQRQANEDSRVELKADWPDDPERAARRIAGHANSSRGEPILWVIGVDEEQGVRGASQNNLANWWPRLKAQFDGPTPQVRDVLLDCKGQTVVALYFETEGIPYVVKNPSYGKPKGGPVELEVPWREGTAIRSATHSDLIQLLSPLQRPILNIEVGKGRGFVNRYPLALSAAWPAGRLGGQTTETRSMHSAPQPTAACYVRVKVVNCGRRTARHCQGYLENVEACVGREVRETDYADFMRLVWSYSAGSPSLDLLPEVPHWLDVISTLEHHDGFFLQTDPKATRYSEGFGATCVYRLTIKVFAEDAEPARAFVYVDWNGNWDRLDVFDEAQWESRKRPV